MKSNLLFSGVFASSTVFTDMTVLRFIYRKYLMKICQKKKNQHSVLMFRDTSNQLLEIQFLHFYQFLTNIYPNRAGISKSITVLSYALRVLRFSSMQDFFPPLVTIMKLHTFWRWERKSLFWLQNPVILHFFTCCLESVRVTPAAAITLRFNDIIQISLY